MNEYAVLYVSYPLNVYQGYGFVADKEIIASIGLKYFDSSSTGYGKRHLEFRFDTYAEATEAGNKFHAAPLCKQYECEVSAVEYDKLSVPRQPHSP